jgi:hypothetical protein
METWGVVFLGIIALSSAIQGVFLVALLVFGRKLAQRVDALSARIDTDITPALENFTRVSRAAAEIADIGALQARRLDLLLTDTVDKIERTTSMVQQLVSRPVRPLGNALAFFKGVQRGAEVFFGGERRGDGRERPLPRRHHRGDDDEHLFI